jgi:hypothetical protein
MIMLIGNTRKDIFLFFNQSQIRNPGKWIIAIGIEYRNIKGKDRGSEIILLTTADQAMISASTNSSRDLTPLVL